MSGRANALVKEAQSYIGTPFCLHGRHQAMGIDCLGLILAALDDVGITTPPPPAYAMRNSTIAPLLAFAEEVGLMLGTAPIQAGDILLGRTGPAQFHCAIALGERGFIHAHAGLRRVVQTPGAFPWPLTRLWRLPSD